MFDQEETFHRVLFVGIRIVPTPSPCRVRSSDLPATAKFESFQHIWTLFTARSQCELPLPALQLVQLKSEAD